MAIVPSRIKGIAAENHIPNFQVGLVYNWVIGRVDEVLRTMEFGISTEGYAVLLYRKYKPIVPLISFCRLVNRSRRVDAEPPESRNNVP